MTNVVDSPVRCHTVRPRPRTAASRGGGGGVGRSVPSTARDEVQPRPLTAGTTRSETHLLRV